LVVLNILRIEDELNKYFIKDKRTIPLSFELIYFLNEYKIPILIIINKIDKVSIFDKKKIINLFLRTTKEYNINLIPISKYDYENSVEIPYLEFSALKRINLKELKLAIQRNFEKNA